MKHLWFGQGPANANVQLWVPYHIRVREFFERWPGAMKAWHVNIILTIPWWLVWWEGCSCRRGSRSSKCCRSKGGIVGIGLAVCTAVSLKTSLICSPRGCIVSSLSCLFFSYCMELNIVVAGSTSWPSWTASPASQEEARGVHINHWSISPKPHYRPKLRASFILARQMMMRRLRRSRRRSRGNRTRTRSQVLLPNDLHRERPRMWTWRRRPRRPKNHQRLGQRRRLKSQRLRRRRRPRPRPWLPLKKKVASPSLLRKIWKLVSLRWLTRRNAGWKRRKGGRGCWRTRWPTFPCPRTSKIDFPSPWKIRRTLVHQWVSFWIQTRSTSIRRPTHLLGHGISRTWR